MNHTAVAALAAAALAAACAETPRAPPLHWWHGTATRAQGATDQYECSLQAAMAAPATERLTSSGGYAIGGTWIPSTIQSRDGNRSARTTLHGLCLRARGWHLAPTDPFTRAAPPTQASSAQRS